MLSQEKRVITCCYEVFKFLLKGVRVVVEVKVYSQQSYWHHSTILEFVYL